MQNKYKRREFLNVSAAGAIGLFLAGCNGASNTSSNSSNDKIENDKKRFGVGLQLYTIRDAMAADVPGSLKKVSDLGYKKVELASYADGKFYGYSPKEFKKMVEDLGMVANSSHTMVEAAGITLDNAKAMADAHAELGVKYCVQPWVNDEDRNIESYKKMIGDWNEVGRIMKGVGIQFGYHNHNFEFATIDGVVPYYDLFMKEMDPDLITMEIDLYWVTKAGQDPIEMFKKYPGRFQLAHYKDMAEDTGTYFDIVKDDITSVGAGLIDFKRIHEALEIGGVKHFYVEDDNQGNGKPFKGIEISIDNLANKILV